MEYISSSVHERLFLPFKGTFFSFFSVQLHCSHVNMSAGGIEVIFKEQLLDANCRVGVVRKALRPSQLSGWRTEEKNLLTFWPGGSAAC